MSVRIVWACGCHKSGLERATETKVELCVCPKHSKTWGKRERVEA